MNFTTYGLSPVAPGIQPISSVLNVKFRSTAARTAPRNG